MQLDRNFQLLESNQCPDCTLPYLKFGVGYDRGINCMNCGYIVPIDKYREVVKDYWIRVDKSESQNEETIE